jgi:hypothetical protein
LEKDLTPFCLTPFCHPESGEPFEGLLPPVSTAPMFAISPKTSRKPVS